MIPKALKANAGQALVAVLLLTLLTVLLGTQTIAAAWSGLFASQTSAAAMGAAAAAEGAVDFGVAALNSTIPTDSRTHLQPLPAGFVASGPRTWRYEGSALGAALGGFAVGLTIEIPVAMPVTGGPGRPDDYRILVGSAVSGGRTREARAIAHLTHTAITVDQAVFPRAITAAGNLQASGTDSTLRTDSYRSAVGPYGGHNTGTVGGVHTNGSVIGGGVYRGSVSAVGSIDGDVAVEGTGNAIRPAAAPVALVSPPAAPADALPVTWAPGQTLQAPADGALHLGAVSLSGQESLTLLPGTYVLESLQISGGGTLRIQGGSRTTLLITGGVDVTGNGIVTASLRPLDLHVAACGSGQPVKIAGNGAFFGLLQAPDRQVILGGHGTFYGAIVGGSVTFNGTNSTVHYDEDAAQAVVGPAITARPTLFRVMAIDLPHHP